ncbi:hypothetical protein V8F44DRAFT_591133 [Aspergillus fumigatus]
MDYHFNVKLFYWHLNRQTRRPSNLTKPEGVETRAERAGRRRRLFDMGPPLPVRKTARNNTTTGESQHQDRR